MTTECEQCGVTSRGAFITEIDGEMVCEDCVPIGECERCGRETDQLTFSGKYRCEDCRDHARGQDTTRDAGQSGLGEWSR